MTPIAKRLSRDLHGFGAARLRIVSLWMIDLARMLKRRLGDRAAKVPTGESPNWVVKLIALRDPTMRMMAAQLGKIMDASSEKTSDCSTGAPGQWRILWLRQLKVFWDLTS